MPLENIKSSKAERNFDLKDTKKINTNNSDIINSFNLGGSHFKSLEMILSGLTSMRK